MSSALCMSKALSIAAIIPITRLRLCPRQKSYAFAFYSVHLVVILEAEQMPTTFQPMPLSRRAKPFNHPEWLFELKYDGVLALARIERNKCELISRNGHPFASFSDLADSMAGFNRPTQRIGWPWLSMRGSTPKYFCSEARQLNRFGRGRLVCPRSVSTAASVRFFGKETRAGCA
jgi:hypothetical protein